MTIFISTFLLIFVTEMADKSRLAGFLLTNSFRSPRSVFWGMTFGYALLEGLSVGLGKAVSLYVPPYYLRIGAGVVFLLIAIGTLLYGEKTENYGRQFLGRFVNWSPFWISFLTISLFELGDRTQFAVASVTAATAHPILVFLGAMSALSLLNIATVLLGQRMAESLSLRLMRTISAIVSGLTGLFLIVRTLWFHG